MRLGEGLLKANIQMVGMRLVKAGLPHLKQGERAHIDAAIVIGQLKPRKHAADQKALA